MKQYGLALNFTWGLAQFVHSNGGEMLSADGKVLLDQPAAIEALQFMADLGAKHFVRQAPHYTPNPNPIGFRMNNLAIGYHAAGRTIFYLSGFDPAFARYSPGKLVVAHAIEQAITRDAARAFDFLRGAEAYKYAWGAVDEPLFRRSLRLVQGSPREAEPVHPMAKRA